MELVKLNMASLYLLSVVKTSFASSSCLVADFVIGFVEQSRFCLFTFAGCLIFRIPPQMEIEKQNLVTFVSCDLNDFRHQIVICF